MSNIVELASDWAQDVEVFGYCVPSPRYDKFQAEVTRMEQELASEKEISKSLRTVLALVNEVCKAMRAKLAALEAQEPVARVTVCDINAIYWLAPTHGATFNTPLYLAAGAKDARVPIEPKPKTSYCVHKTASGGCQLHNLHCAYPTCEMEPTEEQNHEHHT